MFGRIKVHISVASAAWICIDVTLNEAEDVRIGAALDLAQIALLAIGADEETGLAPAFMRMVSTVLLLLSERIPVSLELVGLTDRWFGSLTCRRYAFPDQKLKRCFMQERLEIGDRIRVSSSLASRHRGKLGMILDIERDPHGRADWDMCTVYLRMAGTHQFPAIQLERTASQSDAEPMAA